MDYSQYGMYTVALFQVAVNGHTFTNNLAYHDISQPLSGRTGTWFVCSNNSTSNFGGLALSGGGLFDDLVVATNAPTIIREDQFAYTNNGDGTCTITGYTGGGGDVTIPNTISTLTVASIGSNAFLQCTNLTSVTIPDGVTNIGGKAFCSCSSLTSVTIPNSVTSIGIAAFNGSSLINVIIPSGVTSIGYAAFAACASLTNLTMGTNLASIGDYAFIDCTSLNSVTIPGSVTNIGVQAFFLCGNLTNVTIGTNVINIGDGAFGACTSLTAITVDTNNPAYCSVDGVLFDRSQTVLVQYPGGKSGSSYTVSDGISNIRRLAFHSCDNLTGIAIPNSVTNIGEGAFMLCLNLTSVTIGTRVATIGSNAFELCASLTSVYFKGNAPSNEPSALQGDRYVTVFYLPGTTNWTNRWGGLPTVLWNPHTQSDSTFGVKSNQFGFTITGSTNFTIVVEACTNLTNSGWSTQGTNTLTGGSSYFDDPGWTNSPCRFYRFRSP